MKILALLFSQWVIGCLLFGLFASTLAGNAGLMPSFLISIILAVLITCYVYIDRYSAGITQRRAVFSSLIASIFGLPILAIIMFMFLLALPGGGF